VTLECPEEQMRIAFIYPKASQSTFSIRYPAKNKLPFSTYSATPSLLKQTSLEVRRSRSLKPGKELCLYTLAAPSTVLVRSRIWKDAHTAETIALTVRNLSKHPSFMMYSRGLKTVMEV